MKTNTLLLLTGILTLGAATATLAQSTYTTPYTISTYAGSRAIQGSNDGYGVAAQFNSPYGVALDGSGNLYVADTYNCTIRKITTLGHVTTLAGTAGNYGSADGSGAAAEFQGPQSLAVDGSGNIYVADTRNYTIRKITPTGTVTTLAGIAGTQGATDGSGATATFRSPQGIAVDSSGNLYVADHAAATIRKITPAGVVSTFAGSSGNVGFTDGTGSSARFFGPYGVAVDGNNNVYVSDDSADTIRKITPDGGVTTLVGSAGNTGSADGTGTAALFNSPEGIAADSSGNIFVAEFANDTIRQITPAGVVTTLAGTATSSGFSDGSGSGAIFNQPYGIAVDSNDNIYVADTTNDIIRKGIPPAAPLDLFSGVVTGTNLKRSPWFGHYTYNAYPLVYEYNLGYEYTFDAGGGGVYLYDYSSGHFWYTQASYFPFVYDFTLQAFLYYYNVNTPHRHFYDFNTSTIITE